MLAVLVGLSIVLLTGYFGEGSGGFFHTLQSGAQTILSPVEDGASRAFKPVRDLTGWFGDVFDAKGENEKLRDDLADTRRELAEAQTLIRDDAQLRKLVGLDERLRDETQMPAHLAESPLTCVAVGSGRSLEEFEAIHRSNRNSRQRRRY